MLESSDGEDSSKLMYLSKELAAAYNSEENSKELLSMLHDDRRIKEVRAEIALMQERIFHLQGLIKEASPPDLEVEIPRKNLLPPWKPKVRWEALPLNPSKGGGPLATFMMRKKRMR